MLAAKAVKSANGHLLMIRSCDNPESLPHLRHDSEHILTLRAETWRVILRNN